MKKKPDKVYMHNTNLLYAIMPEKHEKLNLRHTFFLIRLGIGTPLKVVKKLPILWLTIHTILVGGRKTEPPVSDLCSCRYD
jgi:uncharacterized protein